VKKILATHMLGTIKPVRNVSLGDAHRGCH